jgi:hypothetical protein
MVTNSLSVSNKILSLNCLVSGISLIFSFRVQNVIVLFWSIGVSGLRFFAIKKVVTTSALSNHFPFPDITTVSMS